ncbi:MAG: hypothetical protein ABJF10_23020 [Chthoniobacter sp.]|uniref:hypothetical protein n=1 Tax=Chthoniobacter sp. TaxID=2510640 RepID=UPI0032ABD1D2
MKYLRLLLFLCLATAAHAQITVSCSLKQRFHLLYEPVIATVNVTNFTGHDINLSDTPQYQWFGFRITGDGDRMIRPRSLNYHLPPLNVKSGETIKRSVNLNELYEMGETGTFRVQASIYYDGLDKFFTSKPTHIEVNEGHLIWRKIAGIPEGQPAAGQMRIFSLLSHEVGESNNLYVRVEGQDDGMVYCTFPIGRLLDNVAPQAEFDSNDNLYVLHLIGMRAYVLSKISPSGEFGGQTNYSAPKTRPTLRRTAEGALQIIGGKREGSVAQNNIPAVIPKLSDRPPGFPKE